MLEPGHRFGQFQILQLIGTGGIGEVYCAEDTRLGRKVALKILRSGSRDDEQVRRFEREARATAALDHPNIVVVHEFGAHQGIHFIATELLEGQTLRARLAQGPLGHAQALSLALQVARALDCAHQHGVVHRDLKPSNLVVDGNGQVKVLDFGLARLSGAAGSLEVDPDLEDTDPGTVLGSLGYMAPEQVSALPSDHRADLFSLGAILFEMLTGRRAFQGSSPLEIMNATLSREPPGLRDLPAALGALVARCLEKSPERRYRSAAELIADLTAVAAGSSSARTPLIAQRPLRSRPRRAALLLGGALLLLAGLGLLVQWQRRPEPPPTVRRAAVFPFQVHGDARLANLEKGLVDLLGRSLSSSRLHLVPPADSSQRPLGPADLDEARALARRAGADLFVLGTVVEVGDRVHLLASLYETGREAARSDARVAGPTPELLRMIDELALQLRDGLPDWAEPGSNSPTFLALARATTRSPEALRLLLEGDQFTRSGRYQEGRDLLRQAVAAEPGSAVGWLLLAIALYDAQEPAELNEAVDRASSLAQSLPAADRSLVQSWALLLGGRVREARASFTKLVRERPSAPEAWFGLGYLGYYYNAVEGRPLDESLGPLRRATELDPQSGEAWENLAELALALGRREEAARAAEHCLAVLPAGADYFQVARWLHAISVSDPAAAREMLADMQTPRANHRLHWSWIVSLAVVADETLGEARRLAELAPPASAIDPTTLDQISRSLLEAAQGRPRAAKEILRRAFRETGAFRMLRMAALLDTVDFLPASDEELEASRTELLTVPVADAVDQMQREYLIGAIQLRRGGVAAAEESATRLERMPPVSGSTVATDTAHALRARIALAGGQPAAAREQLAAIRLERTLPFAGHALSPPSELLTRGRVIEALGGAQEAIDWWGRRTASTVGVELVYLPYRLQRRAALYERRGDLQRAAADYEAVASVWRDPEPELQAAADEASSKARELRAQLAARTQR
jgi:serine/threonine protein kinase/tetratricopeptide (TPR) repeat protein